MHRLTKCLKALAAVDLGCGRDFFHRFSVSTCAPKLIRATNEPREPLLFVSVRIGLAVITAQEVHAYSCRFEQLVTGRANLILARGQALSVRGWRDSETGRA